MPEVRRRGLSDQIGVGADRTQRGAAQGGGIGPTIARLQQAVRGRVTAGQSRTAGALTVTDYSVGPLDATYVEGEVTVAGLYIVKAFATVTVGSGSPAGAWMEIGGAGSGAEIVARGASPITADDVGFPIGASGTAWCEEGVTLSSSISGATVTAHSLTYTLVAVS